MIKKILKSILVLAIVLATAGVATRAWFTSNVTAADNEIQTGTLMVAVDTTTSHNSLNGTWSYPINYYVVADVDGTVTPGHPFEAWVNAEPGNPVAYNGTWPRPAGNYSYWVAIRNRGTLPIKVLADLTNGAWTSVPRYDGPYNNNLVIPYNIHRYAVTASGGCESHEECQSLRAAIMSLDHPSLTIGNYVPAPVAILANHTPIGSYYLTDNGTSGGTPIVIGAGQFVIYRVDAYLDPTTDDNYQGATYEYDLVVNASQVGGPW